MNPWASRCVAVTGAGGFIGSHLVERLIREGASVRAMVRYNSHNARGALDFLERDVQEAIQVHAGDLRDQESVAMLVEGCDIVFHLAAIIAIPYSYIDPRAFFETNVIGTLNVAQACRAASVSRLVHTSTSEVYGTAQTVPITEDHPLVGQSPYAASKIGADYLIMSFNRSYALPAITVRPFNTFGPRQSARAVIPTIITQALQGDSIQLGSLVPRRDLTYVDDTVEGFLAAATADAALGRTLQLGTGMDLSIGDLVDEVGKLLGRTLVVETDPRRLRPEHSEVMRLVSSHHTMTELTGWRPQLSLRDGLARTLEWIQEHPELYTPDQYVV